MNCCLPVRIRRLRASFPLLWFDQDHNDKPASVDQRDVPHNAISLSKCGVIAQQQTIPLAQASPPDSARACSRVSTAIELQSTAFLVEVDHPESTLQLTDSARLQPLTVFHTPHGVYCDQIRDLVLQYEQQDDVMAPGFLGTIVFVTKDQTLGEDALQLLGSLGCSVVYLLPQPLIQRGPFFYSSEGTEEAFTSRVYEQPVETVRTESCTVP